MIPVSFLVHIEYYYLFIHFLILTFIGFLLIFIPLLLTFYNFSFDNEKLSPYECGFDPFGDARTTFNIHFYLVGILFIIFDLEIMFLFPWAITLYQVSYSGFLFLFFFLIILGIGFIYEWLKGALQWS